MVWPIQGWSRRPCFPKSRFAVSPIPPIHTNTHLFIYIFFLRLINSQSILVFAFWPFADTQLTVSGSARLCSCSVSPVCTPEWASDGNDSRVSGGKRGRVKMKKKNQTKRHLSRGRRQDSLETYL